MIALYNPLQPCPSNTHVGNVFKTIKCQKGDEAIYENEFSDIGLAAPTKSIKKLLRLVAVVLSTDFTGYRISLWLQM